jgi:hypothetical protein
MDLEEFNTLHPSHPDPLEDYPLLDLNTLAMEVLMNFLTPNLVEMEVSYTSKVVLPQ